MGAIAQPGSGSPAALPIPSSCRAGAGGWFQARRLVLVLLALVLTLAPGIARADGAGQRWSLRDQDGNRWSLRIFAQPDPAWPDGDRLRLSALTPGIAVDHEKPLLISDGMGSSWTLSNRSEELLPADQEEPPELPAGSAQFDLAALIPRPSDALPLELSLPLAGEETAVLVLGPEETEALHGFPELPSPIGPR